MFLFLALPMLPILHFLLDQKVKQKIKSHRPDEPRYRDARVKFLLDIMRKVSLRS